MTPAKRTRGAQGWRLGGFWYYMIGSNAEVQEIDKKAKNASKSGVWKLSIAALRVSFLKSQINRDTSQGATPDVLEAPDNKDTHVLGVAQA